MKAVSRPNILIICIFGIVVSFLIPKINQRTDIRTVTDSIWETNEWQRISPGRYYNKKADATITLVREGFVLTYSGKSSFFETKDFFDVEYSLFSKFEAADRERPTHKQKINSVDPLLHQLSLSLEND
jgi:hypothetical protein